VNDAYNMKQFLNRFGFADGDMVVLTDNQPPISQPTRANMIRAMEWLVKDARSQDSLFFHYSGHGGQSIDWSSDQDDVYDETICPLDYKQVGMIANDVHSSLISNDRSCTLGWFSHCHKDVD
jgi:hypothetical protein